ncbi:MAG: DUF4377 domain-containing protein [Prevotella sp.]|nr:DUF4377 domain-containing protein [Prevotella sp.]
MKALKIWSITFATLAVFSLFSCIINNDDEDKVEETMLYVSAETGTYFDLFDTERVHLMEGMQIKEKGDTRWKCVPFFTITGFSYEKGYEYELVVKKTTIANPPQDATNVSYELIRIVSKQKH